MSLYFWCYELDLLVTVSVVFLRALGYYALWVITRSIIVTLCYHLLRALGYNAHLVVIYDFIKLKYSILKILFKIIFCTYYALWVITLSTIFTVLFHKSHRQGWGKGG